MLNIAAFALRGFLVLFGAVVLGLSITLAKGQEVGKPPTETSFSSFCGAFGILVSAIGIIAIFVDKIPPTAIMGADALASVFYLAGGIALTVALKDVSSCTSHSAIARGERVGNKLLNGGCLTKDGGLWCYAGSGPGKDEVDDYTPGRCQRVQADYVFQYLAFAFGIAIIATTFFLRRSGSNRSRAFV
ncbi:Uu.00g056210.m01.CDS01 [Anthostomella pinea]|uniref:Uu.00g056210.m01.CDS01 n=1 Tax=Anthostomella pinea TaxID=933095 RepID=A0AAI8YJM9_9PEZI|nr:Uu.00g056210.m01.CDS01 [Anthostomella pinea]